MIVCMLIKNCAFFRWWRGLEAHSDISRHANLPHPTGMGRVSSDFWRMVGDLVIGTVSK